MTRILQTDLARDALYTKVNQIADEKQDVLEFDTTPTSNSDNPVTSSGIKSALDVKANNADLSNYVTLDTDQTISGNKTFSGYLIKQSNSLEYKGIHIQNTQITKGTTPSSTAGGQFVFQSKDGLNLANRIGGVEVAYDSSGNITSMLSACQPVANSTTYASLAVVYPASGDPYIETDANVTIRKNIPKINYEDLNAIKGTAPSSTTHEDVNFNDKNGAQLTGIVGYYKTNKETQIELRAYKANSSTDSSYGVLSIVHPASGNPYATAPTPAVSASGTTIATAEYINNKFKKVSTLPASPNANTFYFIPE